MAAREDIDGLLEECTGEVKILSRKTREGWRESKTGTFLWEIETGVEMALEKVVFI